MSVCVGRARWRFGPPRERDRVTLPPGFEFVERSVTDGRYKYGTSFAPGHMGRPSSLVLSPCLVYVLAAATLFRKCALARRRTPAPSASLPALPSCFMAGAAPLLAAARVWP